MILILKDDKDNIIEFIDLLFNSELNFSLYSILSNISYVFNKYNLLTVSLISFIPFSLFITFFIPYILILLKYCIHI